MISRHGNYLDDILDWDYTPADQQYYLASSFKLLDKIDVTEVVKMIFVRPRSFTRDGVSLHDRRRGIRHDPEPLHRNGFVPVRR